MMRTFRVYGTNGHRQRMAFHETNPAYTWEDGTKMTILCHTATGSYDYCEVIIEAKADRIEHMLQAQLDDGFFEDARYGEITEIVDGKEIGFDWTPTCIL